MLWPSWMTITQKQDSRISTSFQPSATPVFDFYTTWLFWSIGCCTLGVNQPPIRPFFTCWEWSWNTVATTLVQAYHSLKSSNWAHFLFNSWNGGSPIRLRKPRAFSPYLYHHRLILPFKANIQKPNRVNVPFVSNRGKTNAFCVFLGN